MWSISSDEKPGTAKAVKPETFYEKVGAEDIFFSSDVKWHRGNQVYLRTRCQICAEDFGTCLGPPRMTELRREHQKKCWPCGFPDCVDCKERGWCNARSPVS